MPDLFADRSWRAHWSCAPELALPIDSAFCCRRDDPSEAYSPATHLAKTPATNHQRASLDARAVLGPAGPAGPAGRTRTIERADRKQMRTSQAGPAARGDERARPKSWRVL
ncbi:MAG: hypothetical protein QOE19_952 [Actinomycetota bacterium]|jgi:hypothetical protein|nr:hypothetical protein [Actinomycetota bacterium]MDQ1670250.1 hypothetical protein [Actinomycetota bacterium]